MVDFTLGRENVVTIASCTAHTQTHKAPPWLSRRAELQAQVRVAPLRCAAVAPLLSLQCVYSGCEVAFGSSVVLCRPAPQHPTSWPAHEIMGLFLFPGSTGIMAHAHTHTRRSTVRGRHKGKSLVLYRGCHKVEGLRA